MCLNDMWSDSAICITSLIWSGDRFFIWLKIMCLTEKQVSKTIYLLQPEFLPEIKTSGLRDTAWGVDRVRLPLQSSSITDRAVEQNGGSVPDTLVQNIKIAKPKSQANRYFLWENLPQIADHSPPLFSNLKGYSAWPHHPTRVSHACYAISEFFQSEICIEYFVAFDNSYKDNSMQRGLQNMHIHMTDHYINLLGWVLFLISAIGFCIASFGSFLGYVWQRFFSHCVPGFYDTVFPAQRRARRYPLSKRK